MKNIAEELHLLFNPRHVAVIGASNNWNKWGNSTFAGLLQYFKGDIYPINQREEQVLGRKAYKRVLDVPGPIDLAVMVIPAGKVPAAMQDCADKGVKFAVVISAGFRETGAEGRELEDEVSRIAKNGGVRFVGPNCMGMWSAPSQLSAYMFSLPSKDGPVAFVTQGGNVGGALMGSADGRGLNCRYYVSCGPAADIQLEDYIEYYGEDDAVKVIIAYIEGVHDGRRFLEKVSRVTCKKPVIVYKAGRSEAVAKAILSHSGSLAGEDAVFDKAMKKAGVIRVDSPEEMLDAAIAFLTQPLPKGRNVGIITGGGSYGVICTEDCARAGLEVPMLPEHTINSFSEIFPPRWSHGNPVDPAGDRNFIGYYLAPKIIMEIPEIDALIFMGFGSLAGFGNLLDKKKGTQTIIDHIPESLMKLKKLEGMEELVQSFVTSLAAGDMEATEPLLIPMLHMVAQIFGSDPDTVARLMDVMLPSADFRATMAHMISSLFALADKGEDAMPEILVLIDELISATLENFMKIYQKPIISTTFMDTPQAIKGAYYPYTSSAKAVRVLSMLVEYREYLEKNGAFQGPMQICELLKQPRLL